MNVLAETEMQRANELIQKLENKGVKNAVKKPYKTLVVTYKSNKDIITTTTITEKDR